MIRPIPVLLLLGGVALAAGGNTLQARTQAAPAPDSAPVFGPAEPGQGAPMAVTTDTLDYCTVLEHRIMEQPNRPPEVRQLLREGHQLCDHGQVRVGIWHLRRALLLLKRKPVPPHA